MSQEKSYAIPEDVLDKFAEMHRVFLKYYNGGYGLVSVQSDDVHLSFKAFTETFEMEEIRMLDRGTDIESDMFIKELWTIRDGTRFFCLATARDLLEALIMQASESEGLV